METYPPKGDQETSDPAWQKVETRKMKKKKENKKEGKEDGRSRLWTRRTRPCALMIKSTKKSYADILIEVKKELTLQVVGLAVARVRKTLNAMSFSYLIRITRTKPRTLTKKSEWYLIHLAQCARRRTKLISENGTEGSADQSQPLRSSKGPTDPDGARGKRKRGHYYWPIQELGRRLSSHHSMMLDRLVDDAKNRCQ